MRIDRDEIHHGDVIGVGDTCAVFDLRAKLNDALETDRSRARTPGEFEPTRPGSDNVPVPPTGASGTGKPHSAEQIDASQTVVAAVLRSCTLTFRVLNVRRYQKLTHSPPTQRNPSIPQSRESKSM